MTRLLVRTLQVSSILICACVHRAPFTAPIATDRPDQTQGTELIAATHTQLEGGFSLYHSAPARNSQTIGEAELRYGVSRRFEAELFLPSVVQTSGAGHEWTNGALGFKTPLFAPGATSRRAAPALSLLATTNVSTNWSRRTALSTPEVILAAAWSLSDPVDLTMNIVGRPFDTSDAFEGVTASLGIDLSDRLGSYVEVYNLGAFTADGGLTYRLTPNFQIDARVGRTIQTSTATTFAGAGVGVRW